MDSVLGLHYHSIGASRSSSKFGRHIKDVTKISSFLGAHNVKTLQAAYVDIIIIEHHKRCTPNQQQIWASYHGLNPNQQRFWGS